MPYENILNSSANDTSLELHMFIVFLQGQSKLTNFDLKQL